MTLLPALWSLTATAALGVFATIGLLADQQALAMLMTAILLGCALGSLRFARIVQLVLVSLVPPSLAVPAVFAWVPDAELPITASVALAAAAALGLAAGRPNFDQRARQPALAALVRGLCIAVAAVAVGVLASFSMAAALTVAAAAAVAWVIVLSTSPQPKRIRRDGLQPTELLQTALVAAGTGGWAVLSLVIADQAGITDELVETGTPALPIAVAVAAAAAGAGLGAAAALALLRQGIRLLPQLTLVIALVGMALVMIARPGGLAAFAAVGVLVAVFGLAAAVTIARTRPAPEPAPATEHTPSDTAAIARRLFASEAVLERFAIPAVLASAALGALIGGLLGSIVEVRDALFVSLAAVAAAAVWIAVRRQLAREVS